MTVNNSRTFTNALGNQVTIQHGVGAGGHSFTRKTVDTPDGQRFTGVDIEGHRTGMHVAGSQASQDALHGAVAAARGQDANTAATAALTPPPADAAVPAAPSGAAPAAGGAADPAIAGLQQMAQQELTRIQHGLNKGILHQGPADRMTQQINAIQQQLASGNLSDDQINGLAGQLDSLSGQIFNRKQSNRLWQEGANGQISEQQMVDAVNQVHQSHWDIAAGNDTAADAYSNLQA